MNHVEKKVGRLVQLATVFRSSTNIFKPFIKLVVWVRVRHLGNSNFSVLY